MPPIKLSHVVLLSGQLPKMRDWYLDVLEARVVHEGPGIVFLTYDEEHHRVAIVDPAAAAALSEQSVEGLGSLAPQNDAPQDTAQSSPLSHIAFTYAGLPDLLDNYGRLKMHGVLPVAAINHGTTTSLYYADPDGNNVELQVDNFARMEDAVAFMESDAFAKNPVGIQFDPDQMSERLAQGAAAEDLIAMPA